jgi:hypothetical protein
MNMNLLNIPKIKWSCGAIAAAALVICGVIFLIPQFLGRGDTPEPTVVANGGNDVAQNPLDNIHLGSLEIGEAIDRDGCAINNVSSLQNSPLFYVIAPNSEFPSGTTIFVRLYRDGRVVEDSPLITANQDYSSSCVNFVFETVDGNDFEAGEYEAEFWVNGNSYNTISFNLD